MKNMIIGTLALTLMATPALMAGDGERKGPGHKRGGDFHKKMLEKFDADNDGKLNEEERANARAEGEARRAEMKAKHEEMKKKFDTDGDGKLNHEERRAAFESQLASGDLPPHVMERIDKDGDGTISDDERAVMKKKMEERRGKMEERRAKMLEKCDTNGDGELSEDERKACKEKMRGERGERGGKKPGRRGERGGDSGLVD